MGQKVPMREIAIPLHLATRLENKNFVITRWNRISSYPSDYNMVAAEAKHVVSYSQYNLSFVMIKIFLTKVGL